MHHAAAPDANAPPRSRHERVSLLSPSIESLIEVMSGRINLRQPYLINDHIEPDCLGTWT